MSRNAAPSFRRWTAPATALMAAIVVIGSTAPGSALTSTLAAVAGPAHHHREHSTFHRHFYRGQSTHSHVHTARADMMPMAEDADWMNEAHDYCGSRFKSYDPSTGTYLGYDGNEHACP